MKTLFTLIIFIVCILYNVAHAEPGTTGAEIFDLPITTLSGDTFTLGDYQNRQPVYLKFWATWCQPCRKEMPHLSTWLSTEKTLINSSTVIPAQAGIYAIQSWVNRAGFPDEKLGVTPDGTGKGLDQLVDFVLA